MSGLIDRLDRSLYPEFERNWDDRLFRDRILEHISPEKSVLDVGAGAGIVAEMDFRGKAGRICGIDLDPRVTSNPYLDDGQIADAGAIPYPDKSFDIVFADNVMEHLDKPQEVFKEISRVLKPGGMLLFKTPNRTHYMPLIARLTPHKFHQFVNRLRGREEQDTFPTLYRSNSMRQVNMLAEQTDFEVHQIDLIEGRPEYLRMTAPTYLVGVAYERLVNASPALRKFRILLIAELRKVTPHV